MNLGGDGIIDANWALECRSVWPSVTHIIEPDAGMPKTLPKKDPNLVEAVNRLTRVQRIWGLLLVGLGALTEWVGASNHPMAGLPLIAVGLFALVWAEPAVLAAVAVAVAFSMAPTVNPRLSILGPDPLRLAL